MGPFANTLFSLLLGWVQTAASWLWGLVTSSDVHRWFRWLLEHWLFLLVVLCIGGMVLDFIVYLFRWQPYRVWRSFLRGLSAKDAAEDDEISPSLRQRTWIYADGSTAVEAVQESIPEVPPAETKLDAPIRPARRIIERAAPEQAYHRPVYPPQWQHSTQNQGDKG